MGTLRSLRWPDDRPALLALDVSFSSDYMYNVVQTDRSLALHRVPLIAPLQKDYHFAPDVDTLPTFDAVVVAERTRDLVGIAAMRLESWNRRVNLVHCHVARGARGQGIGRALIAATVAYAQTHVARCVAGKAEHQLSRHPIL